MYLYAYNIVYRYMIYVLLQRRPSDCISSGRGLGGALTVRPLIETKIKKSSCVCQENQAIKAVFADQNILIAVTNGNTRPMVVTTPCRQGCEIEIGKGRQLLHNTCMFAMPD